MDATYLLKEAFEKGGLLVGLLVAALIAGYIYLLREVARLRDKAEKDAALARKDRDDHLEEVRRFAERYERVVADLARITEAASKRSRV